MRLKALAYLCGFAASAAGGALAKPTRFEVKDAAFRNVIQFSSDAPLEKVVATSHFVTGWVEIDPQNLKGAFKGEWEVDMRGFEMGPDSRQVKLRETLLSTAEFPGASFKADKLTEASANELAAGKSVTARVSGTLVVRGVARRQEMAVKATYFPETDWTKKRLGGNLLKMSTTFDLTLSDVKFTIPDVLSGLLAPTLKVAVDAMGTDQLPVATP